MTFLLLSLLLGSPVSWCSEPLQYRDVVRTTEGEWYVKDVRGIRRIERRLLTFYKLAMRPCCIATRGFLSRYRVQDAFIFRPDKDLEVPVFLRSGGKVFVWLRGRIFRLDAPYNRYPLRDRSLYVTSRLVIDALPFGGILTIVKARRLLRPSSSRMPAGLDGAVVRARSGWKIYLIRGGKRYYLWNRVIRPSQIRVLPDAAFYTIAYGGTLF